MTDAGVEADMITYSALLSGCEKSGQFEKAMEVLDTLQRAGMQATTSNYNNVITYLGNRGRSEEALEYFLAMQIAGQDPTLQTCSALMSGFEKQVLPKRAMQLIQAMRTAGMVPDPITCSSALRTLAVAGDPWRHQACQLFETCRESGTVVTGAVIKGLLGCGEGDEALLATIHAHLNSLGIPHEQQPPL
jgi:pentatricopeptide repeat domain-containing protein 1